MQVAGTNPPDGAHSCADPFFVRFTDGLLAEKQPAGGVAGIVEAVWAGSLPFKPGDAVFGESGGGSFAEYVCAPAGAGPSSQKMSLLPRQRPFL
ncbi:MAG: hypothetical protein R3D55_07555 [Chloroflexota bacterium]